MHVPKDMQPRPRPPDLPEQMRTPQPHHVEMGPRWAVGDEDINAVRHRTRPHVLGPGELERPSAIARRAGASVDDQLAPVGALDGRGLVAEVRDVPPVEPGPLVSWVSRRVEKGVVVAGDDDLVRVRLCPEPVQRGLELLKRPALRQVAHVDEHVAVGEFGRAVMGV